MRARSIGDVGLHVRSAMHATQRRDDALRCSSLARQRRYHCACQRNLAAPPSPIPELFRAFASMSLHGFGGVLPWARRAIVEEKRWMTPQEFNEAFAVAQFLPGANVVNLAIVFGGRLHGAAGRGGRARRPAASADGDRADRSARSTGATGTSMRCSACSPASRRRPPA